LLPETMEPLRYDIKLIPNLEQFTFEGEVTVRVKTAAVLETREVIMHAKELAFHSASYSVVDGTAAVEAEEIRTHTKATTVTFVFPQALPASSDLDVTIRYTGLLNNQMAGFYRSQYKDVHGNSKYMASTQFESLDARRAFPCWDEPSRKAIFAVTLVVDSHLTCMSNMPEKCVSSFDNKKKEITYLDSPKMSSYLLAFVVGEFDYVQKLSKHGVLIRLYTPPGKSNQGDYALQCAVDALDLYDDFFNVPYPLPKLDMVAIPEFAAGAMENWGLVTYREVDLLIDPIKASNAQKQRVCVVVAHELAHQWFGNLVTMAWWDDLWLNEGFASWAENYACDKLHPDWKMWEQFVTDHAAAALRLDSLRSSHPIQVPIHHAEEVEQVFDAISYCKGGCVVRMIRAVIGIGHFQKGLSNYMDEHKFGNTETYDLWLAWESVSCLPVKEMMASWTEQMGFPLLKVIDETWDEHQVTLKVAQSWFLSDGSEIPGEEAKKWCIPVITCTSNGIQPDITFLREDTATIVIPLNGPEGWVKLNAGQDVPMRVSYTSCMLKRMAIGIKTRTLGVSDRAGLLGDAYALVKAGGMKPEDLIILLSHYSGETDAVVWGAISGVLSGLTMIMSDDQVMNDLFRSFARKLVKNLTMIVSWEAAPSDGHLTALLRATMVNLLSIFCYDDPDVALEASTRFKKFLENPSDVTALPSDLKTGVFEIYVKNGDIQEYEEVLAYFDSATDNAERKHTLSSLGSTLSSNLKRRTLLWTLSGKIKLQDFFYPMGSVGRSSKEGRQISWEFFQENFDNINGMIQKASPSLMDACIVSCCGTFCSEEMADEIDSFFKANPLPRNARKIAQTTETIRANAKFLKKLQESELSNAAFWESSLLL